jgi:hypothetical protein
MARCLRRVAADTTALPPIRGWRHQRIAALPRAEAARFARHEYANQGSGGFDYMPPAPPLPAGEPPADFTCAPAGTRFVLTMEATATGLPIVWESLGQKGWDCRIRSTVSGEHSIWNWTANDDQANTLRQLWPLQVGKRAGSRRVVSYGPYWLPWGTVNAYAIEETTNDKAGAPWYRSTVYWAPSLGFEIGRHMQVLHGAWPDDAGPDFQTVAMLPPAAAETAPWPSLALCLRTRHLAPRVHADPANPPRP